MEIDALTQHMQQTLADLGVSQDNNADAEDADEADESPSSLPISLPELIQRMQQMVEVMERNTESYDNLKVHISYAAPDSRDSRSSLWLNDAGRDSVYSGNRGSLVGYHDGFSSSRGSESYGSFRSSESHSGFRGSESYSAGMRGSESYSSGSHGSEVHAREVTPPMSAPGRMSVYGNNKSSSFETPEEEPRQSFAFSEAFKKPSTTHVARQRKSYSKPAPVAPEVHATHSRRRLDIAPLSTPVVANVRPDYTVRWASGDLGISLNNFTSDRRGLQISSLERCASGVAGGIGNARLGDTLVLINKESVDGLPYAQIKDILKKTRRPMLLGFKSNPSSVTSPTSAKRYASNQRTFEEETTAGAAPTHCKDEPSLSNVSTADSSLADSDELEDWLRRQDALHSDLVLLLTETIQRCESLKEENFDQLQLMMQRTLQRRNSTFLRRDSRDF
ncbi:hypothetical protein ACHHYP_14579 [Achlya hypogyna]|uniref:PDZ domain-containing protein n=1 Tax=Achlya hypogyna TaxID=1202772 RepID=A0A1V9YCR5_ACHHY|nr:hypothetical protein ACHHYP_14579 [Achlya hypogyna]